MKQLIIAMLILMPASGRCGDADPPALSAADGQLLEALIPTPLVDPLGKTWVSVPVTVRSVWAEEVAAHQSGWLLPAGEVEGGGATVLLVDGQRVRIAGGDPPAAHDFVAECTAYLAQGLFPDGNDKADQGGRDAAFAHMARTSDGIDEIPPLALVAWLHRLGHDDRAAQVMARARSRRPGPDTTTADLITEMRGDLAGQAFAAMVHAYMVRADDQAVGHGRRLLALYPDLAPLQGKQLLAEIERRRHDHHDDRPGAFALPGDWPAWDEARRIAYLIDALDMTDARQMGQPGGIDFASDPRVAALIDIGDPAVPALIDALEQDQRLTRSVEFWRDFVTERTVVAAREVELCALMSILRFRAFAPSSTGDSFTVHGDGGARETAAKIRDFWRKAGGRPLAERLLSVLLDRAAEMENRLEAARNLALIDQGVGIGTTFASDHVGPPTAAGTRRKAAALALHDPTVAEAMLQTLDQCLGTPTGKSDEGEQSFRVLLWDLVHLQDRRIAPAMNLRATQQARLDHRCVWAWAADQLGAPDEMRRMCLEVAALSIRPPAAGQPSASTVSQFITTLGSASCPEAHAALLALARADHPYHRMAVDETLAAADRGGDPEWFRDPAWIDLLASALDDQALTGRVWSLKEGKLCMASTAASSQGDLPGEFPRELWASTSNERRCDVAAWWLSYLVAGLPAFHPLLSDRERRIKQITSRIRDHGASARLLTEREAEIVRGERNAGYPLFGFAPPPLARPAFAGDQQAGRALFSLGSGARITDLALPAKGLWHIPGPQPRTAAVLVFQVEDDAHGQPCGSITHVDHGLGLPCRVFAGFRRSTAPASRASAGMRQCRCSARSMATVN